YIGLMSGTSMDGVDGALCRFKSDGQWDGVVAHIHHPFDPALQRSLQRLQSNGPDELHQAALAGNALALAYAAVCTDLLLRAEVSAGEVRAIGAHGQTVRHRPGEFDGTGYTLQLNQPALLAERTGIDVIADFRSRDVAAHGQGAPLVSPFHKAAFGLADRVQVVANIGGISNLTVLRPTAAPLGFDCGPGNALLDHWCTQRTGEPFDEAGRWAATGQVQATLLARLESEPYFAAPPPKSTGRDLFNPSWLTKHLTGFEHLAAADVQATLSQLTARTIAHQVTLHAPDAADLLVCGGGALNLDLMQHLQALLPGVMVVSTAQAGLPPMQVEAAAFAWLARQHCHRETGSLASVTGALGPRILGACYPG
ncbi:MAG: anhydro-N-acetylmuramic acid kinase, partial [Burkholderiales bacterium]